MEGWRNYLNEAEEEAAFGKFLENLFNKVLKLFGSNVVKTADQVEKKLKEQISEEKERLDEVGFLFAAGLTLALPAIVKLFAGLAKVFGNAIKGWTGKDLGIEAIAEKIMEYAEKAHHLFQKPVGFFVRKVLRIKDEEKAHQATELLFTLLVAFFMVYSGVGAAAAAQKGKAGLATIEGALTAVKGGEVTGFLKTSLQRIAGTVG